MAYYGDSIGGAYGAFANDQARRDAASQATFAALMQAAGRMQQQQQFNTQTAQRNAEHAAALAQNQQNSLAAIAQHNAQLGLEKQKFDASKEYQDWLMKQPSKDASKETKEGQTFRANYLIEQAGKGNFNRNDPFWRTQQPGVVDTAEEIANQSRKELKSKYDRVFAAAALHNQARRMEEVASGIDPVMAVDEKGNKVELGGKENSRPWYSKLNPFSYAQTDPNAADPKLIAQDLRTKALKLKTDNAGLLKEASDFKEAGLTQDPKTKQYIANYPDWYKELIGNQLRMVAPTASTGTNAPPLAANPLAGLAGAPPQISAPPPPMTGTNRPSLDPQTAMQFLIQAKGDRAAARAEAIRRGYTIPLIPAPASP